MTGKAVTHYRIALELLESSVPKHVAGVVSRVIRDNSAHCTGGADIEVNVCATPRAYWNVLIGTGH
jgi:hypothetical protein